MRHALELAAVAADEKAAPFAAALQRDEFREALDRVCRSEPRWGAPTDVRVQVLKSHPRRCAFEIAVKTDTGWHAMIAKMYVRDRSDIARTMEALRRAGFGTDAEFSIAQPFAHVGPLNLRLEEKVPGPSAKEVLLTGSPEERDAAAGRCGRWLARFQATAPLPPVAPGTGTDAGAELSRWQRWTEDLTHFGGPFAGRARALLERLTAVLPALRAGERCAAHGSYIPNHVILCGRRTAAIDLDRYGTDDPSRELAGFVLSVQRLALKSLGAFHALDAAAEAFSSAYLSAGACDADTVTRSHFYRAVECLRRVRRDLVGQSPPALEWAEVTLQEGLRALRRYA